MHFLELALACSCSCSCREMDPGLEEAISTLLWAAPRLSSEVQEMRVIAEQFAQKYGKEFAKECVTAQPIAPASGAAAAGAVSVGGAGGGGGLESEAKAKSRDADYYWGQVPPGPLGAGAATPATYTKVSAKVMSKMAVQAPPRHLVERYLMEISKAYSVQFEPDQRVLAEYEANSAKDLLLELSGSVPAAPTMSALAPSHVPPPAANYPPVFPTPAQVPGYGVRSRCCPFSLLCSGCLSIDVSNAVLIDSKMKFLSRYSALLKLLIRAYST